MALGSSNKGNPFENKALVTLLADGMSMSKILPAVGDTHVGALLLDACNVSDACVSM